MKYLTFVRHSESYRESPPPAALMEAMGKFVETSLKDGTLVDTGGLLPSKDGVRVRLKNGKITVTDGPFTESKEVIGGCTASTGLDSRGNRSSGRCSIRGWDRRAPHDERRLVAATRSMRPCGGRSS
jgi:YCII-related domain